MKPQFSVVEKWLREHGGAVCFQLNQDGSGLLKKFPRRGAGERFAGQSSCPHGRRWRGASSCSEGRAVFFFLTFYFVLGYKQLTMLMQAAT